MSVDETIPGADEAHKLLDQLEAEMTAADKNDKGKKAADGVNEEAQHAEQKTDDAQTQAKSATDNKSDTATPANADEAAKAAEAAGKAGKTDQAAEAAGETGKGSRFSQSQGRLQGGWKEYNAAKDALKTEKEVFAKQVEADKAELKRQREEFEAERNQAEEQFTPEKYEYAAKQFEDRATALEAKGKFDEADEQKSLAKMAKAKADQVRRNPPAKAADRNAAASKEWALKAGNDFPELIKDKSAMQIRVAQLLKDEPDLKAHPKGIYMAARLADLEAKAKKGDAAIASVAGKDVEIGKLKERIKELEEATAPGGEGGAQTLPGRKGFEQLSDDEQLAILQKEASAIPMI